jgi:hypothetical protein
MKFSAIILFFSAILCLHVSAQETDSIPINTKGLNIRLKRNPLPSRSLPLSFEPVKIAPIIINAKVNYWKTKTSVNLNVNQASFSDNWKNGGVNSLSIGGLLNNKAEYSKNSYSYVSEVILQYGKIRNKNQLQKKTTDRIYWDNKASFQLSKNWYFFASVNFESQFDNGYSYSKNTDGSEKETIISKFMGPGYFTESVGFEYKPSKFFSTRIGTGTARQTFVLDTNLYKTNDKNFGVPHGKKFKNELAFQVVSAFEKEIFTNINLKTRYAMFIPYENFKADNIDHRLDVGITAKINRFMNTSITGVILYDKDTDTKVQASQTLALGFGFIFPR